MTQPYPEDTGLMWGGLAEGWGPATGTVPARQPEHELRERVSHEEGMRRTLLGGILMASRTRLGRHPPEVGGGHSWTRGPRLSWDHRALAGGECWSGPR